MPICPFMSNFISGMGHISHHTHNCEQAYCAIWDKENRQCCLKVLASKEYTSILEKIIQSKK